MKSTTERLSLGDALCRFQLEVTLPPLDGTNPHFKSKYTTLSAAREAIVPLAASLGIAVCQDVQTVIEGDRIFASVTTILSGGLSGDLDRRFGPLLVPAQSATAQHLAGAVTYGRRISLLSAFALAGEDDLDGEENRPANGKPPTPTPPPSTKPQAARPPTPPAPSPPPAKAAPAAPQKAAKPAREGTWVEAKEVKRVWVKDGERDGRPWRKFDVVFLHADGSEHKASTFDLAHGEACQQAAASGGSVWLELAPSTRDERYTDLLNVERGGRATVDDDVPEPPAPDDDIPFSSGATSAPTVDALALINAGWDALTRKSR